MPSNTAAWQTASKAKPLEIKPAPYTAPKDNELVVRSRAVAINPVDWTLQEMGNDLFNFIRYPTILGWDVAGEVVEVGRGAATASRFKVGDRVLGHCVCLATQKPSMGAFQTYTILLAHMASPVPDSLAYENAAVLPLGISTASCGLFQKDFLALQYPTLTPKPTGKTVLVWGGATSVGSNAIQLAVAAGYEVIATASAKNFEYVKNLGAREAFDYNSKTVTDDLVNACKSTTVAGVFAATHAPGVYESCAEFLLQSEGVRFIAACRHPPENVPDGISIKMMFASTLKDNEVSKVVYEDFLPKALAEGKYIAAPDAEVVGKGLEIVQSAFEVQKKGMSAKKVVVLL